MQSGTKLLPQKLKIKMGCTIPIADICKNAVDHKFITSGGCPAEFHGRTAKTADIGTAIRQIPYTFYILMLEDKIQKPSDYLFCFFFIGGLVADQSSGDRRFIRGM